MRCRRLALALTRMGASCLFLMRRSTPDLRALLVADGIEAIVHHAGLPGTSSDIDARWSATAVGDARYDWLVVDHYDLDAEWEVAMSGCADRIMAIDDLANRSHACSILLDVNAYLEPERRYVGLVRPGCTMLLGPRYALIDEAFASFHARSTPRSGPVDRVFVGFGGADQDDYTGRVVEGLAGLSARPAKVDVVVGGAYPYPDRLRDRCRELDFDLYLQPHNIPALMADADLAVGGGGSMTWERCCVGVPTLAFVIASNQRRVVSDGAALGLLYAPEAGEDFVSSVTRHVQCLIENPSLRNLLSKTALSWVDGMGVSRVVRAMYASQVTVRPADSTDVGFLFECRNHPAVRAVSRDTAEVSFETHQRWFASAMANPDRLILIGTSDGERVGFVRFDIAAYRAEVSIVVRPGKQGSGVGGSMLRAAERTAARMRPEVQIITAVVLEGNRASAALFESAGYALSQRSYTKTAKAVDT
jgi:UDP-2,4-diacetamido-2,4,6-trideoxy-beta-L-altropyranose hydrolase